MTDKVLPDLVRRELVHESCWMKLPAFLQEIEKTGGWPEGYTHVSFFHDGPCGDRYCMFTTHSLRTGWWTTVATADDYYWYKLTPEKKAEVVKEAKRELVRQLSA